jgi:hypothetical protein
MATQPKPKPKPDPDPPEPKPDDDAAAHHYGDDAANHGRAGQTVALDTRDGRREMMERMDAGLPEATAATSPVIEEPPAASLHERIEVLWESQNALIERVTKLEERVAAPPVGIGRRP